MIRNLLTLILTLSFTSQEIFAQADDEKPVQVHWAHHLNSSPSTAAYTFHEQHSVDKEGNIISVGYFKGRLKIGSFELDKEGLAGYEIMAKVQPDIFVYKTSPAGEVIWAKQIHSPDGAGDVGVSTDADGNIYIAGGFINELFFAGKKVISGNNRWNTFLCKLNKNGDFVWIKGILGTTALSEARVFGVVAANSNGEVAVSVNFSNSIKLGTQEIDNEGQAGNNLVVAKYSSNGDLVWYSNPAAETNTEARAILISDSGEVYLTGSYTSKVVFGATTLTTTKHGYGDIFLCKINADGKYAWAKSFNKTSPGELNNTGKALVIDSQTNHIYLSGDFKGNINFDGTTLSGLNTSEDPGNADIFLAKLTTNGGFIWAQRLGTYGHDFVNDIALGTNGEVAIAGAWGSQPFTNTYSADGKIILEAPFRTLSSGYATGVTALTNHTFYISGVFSSSLYVGDRQWTTFGQRDSFVMKIQLCKSNLSQTVKPLLKYECNKLTVLNKGDYPINWYLNGQLLPGETTEELVVKVKGEYTAEFKSLCGVSSSSLKVGVLKEQYKTYNIITPNGDNKNDKFTVDPALVGTSLQVFNRWGKKVYESSSYQNDWDGGAMPSGVYYWFITTDCQEKLTGAVTIVR